MHGFETLNWDCNDLFPFLHNQWDQGSYTAASPTTPWSLPTPTLLCRLILSSSSYRLRATIISGILSLWTHQNKTLHWNLKIFNLEANKAIKKISMGLLMSQDHICFGFENGFVVFFCAFDEDNTALAGKFDRHMVIDAYHERKQLEKKFEGYLRAWVKLF